MELQSLTFPRPLVPHDITLVGPEVLSQTELFTLLTDANATPWLEKVGPTSPTRLLLTRGWVCKTRVSQQHADLHDVDALLRAQVAVQTRLGIWHPSKCWFIIRFSDRYWPCSATPQLRMVAERRPKGLRTRSRTAPIGAKARVFALIARTVLVHGILLDYKHRNYGFEQDGRRVFYVDDELYGFRTWKDVLRVRWHPLT